VVYGIVKIIFKLVVDKEGSVGPAHSEETEGGSVLCSQGFFTPIFLTVVGRRWPLSIRPLSSLLQRRVVRRFHCFYSDVAGDEPSLLILMIISFL
jgi:hypothetical protein